MSGGGGEGRAGDDQVREIVSQRQLVEKPVGHAHPVAVIGCRELPPQDLAQGPGGLNRYDLPATLDELKRQPPRARADLGDPVRGARQPANDTRMEALGAGQPVIEFRFEPVQQFPRQDQVRLRITVPVRNKPARLLAGQHAKVRGRVASLQFPARPGHSLRLRPGRSLRLDHC